MTEQDKKNLEAAAARIKARQPAPSPAAAQSNSPSFMDMTRNIFGDIKGVASDFQKRMANTEQAFTATRAGQQTGAEAGIQTLGEAGGLIGDVLGRGISAAGRVANKGIDMSTPDVIENPLRQGVGTALSAAQTNIVDPIAAKYAQFEKNNPRAARNINSAANIASAIPILGAEGAAAKASVGAASDIARTLPADLRTAAETAKASQVAKSVDGLEHTYMEIATQTKAGKKGLNKAAVRQQYLDAAGTEGASSPRILAEQGIIPNKKGDILDTIDQANEMSAKTLQMNKVGKDALRQADATAKPLILEDLKNEAIKKARSAKNIDNGTAPTLVNHINEAFAEFGQEYGDSVLLSKGDEIKSARWGQTKFESAKPFQGDANYIIGSTFQKAIEKNAAEAGFNDVAQFHRMIGDRIQAAKFLQGLDGSKIRGGQFTKLGLKVGGAIAGAATGTGALGSIVGMIGGDMLSNLLVSNTVASPMKRFILNGLKVENPAVYDKVIKEMTKRKLLPDILALPAGTTKVPSFPSIPLEGPGIASGKQAVAPPPFTAGMSGAVPQPPAPLPKWSTKNPRKY